MISYSSVVFFVFSIIFLSFTCGMADDKSIEDFLDPYPKHCECINYDCGCCTKVYIKNVLDGNLCSNFSYLPEEYGISVTITYNNIALINETISAKNPPPVCVIHCEKLRMEFCLRFYDLDIKNKCLSGCAEFEVEFFNVLPLKKYKLGCFGCNEPSILPADWQIIINYLKGKKSLAKKYWKDEPNVVLI